MGGKRLCFKTEEDVEEHKKMMYKRKIDRYKWRYHNEPDFKERVDVWNRAYYRRTHPGCKQDEDFVQPKFYPDIVKIYDL